MRIYERIKEKVALRKSKRAYKKVQKIFNMNEELSKKGIKIY